ncbi:MAG: biopolymer transporter ExbD [Gemmataceae bacterium]|nr:biopolymer transporter ExbD [Gemmataceae bacterium]
MANRRKKELPISIAVPIVPMLDMSFQLLSFFIITFKPMPTEGQLAINLPKLDATDQPPPLEPIPPEDKKDEYTVSVFASSDGGLALLGLKGPTANLENIRSLNELLGEMKKIPKPGGDAGKVSITIEAANDLNYSRLIEVMDLCKKAGFDSVNLMPMKRGGG